MLKLYSLKYTIKNMHAIITTKVLNFALVFQFMCLKVGYGMLLTINHAISNISGIKNIV